MKNALEGTGNKADQMEKRISNLKVRNLEMIQMEGERELRFFLERRNLMRVIRLH